MSRKNVYSFVIAFVLISFLAIFIVLKDSKNEQIEQVKLLVVHEAESHYNNIAYLRVWHDKFGGIFQKNSEFQENKYSFEIVSKNPKNPQNLAKKDDLIAFDYFAKNKNENIYFTFDDKTKELYFLGVLKAKADCIVCHRGYNVGDIRGGIRMHVPLETYRKNIDVLNDKYNLFLVLTFISSLVFLVVVLYLLKKLFLRQSEIEGLNYSLEKKVYDRTKELEIAYSHEHYLKNLLETITDINESLITAFSISSIVESAIERLKTHSNYKLIWYGDIDSNRIILRYHNGDKYHALQDIYVLKSANSNNNQIASCAIKAAEENKTIIQPVDFGEFSNLQHRDGDYFLRHGISILIRPNKDEQPYGVFTLYTDRVDGFDDDEINLLETLARDISMALSSYKQRSLIEKMQGDKISNYEETILAFVDMIEQRDAYTAGHTLRVAKYSRMIAIHLKLDNKEIDKLEKAAILHDIGKISTPDSILLKPGKLNPLEFNLIKNHVKAGFSMLCKIEMYRELADIMIYHHEKYDGTGYPYGKKSDEIPLLAHILIVADAFDAMTTNRIYKSRKTVYEAINEIVELGGSHFHPEVAKTAALVLDNVNIENTNQLPNSDLEKQRFSYFFNDSLTGFYNEHYLQVVLNKKEQSYKCLNIVLLKNLTHYNKTEGWSAGNELLSAFSKELSKMLEGFKCDVFRFHGDDFVILAPEHLLLSKIVKNNFECLKEKTVKVVFEHYDLSEFHGISDYIKQI